MRLDISAGLQSGLVRGALLAGAMALSISAHAQAPYKIGAVLCSSGPFASVGLEEWNGAQLAEQDINAAGGVDGRKIQVIHEDDQGRADLSVIRANKLIDQDKVSAMIACFGAGATAYAGSLQKNKVPLFAMIGSASITGLNNPYIFRALMGDPTVVVSLAELLKKQGKKRVSIVYQGDTYGTGAMQVLKDSAKKNGFELVAAESFPVQANLDLTPQLTRMRSTNPDAVVVWAGVPQTIVALKNMQQLGLKTQIYGGVPMSTGQVPAAAGDAVEGAITPDAIDRTQPNPAHLAYNVKYRKAFGKDPANTYGMAAYDAVKLVAEALKGSNGDGAKVMANGEKIRNYQGLMGNYSYSRKEREGLGSSSVVWHQYKGGKLELLK